MPIDPGRCGGRRRRGDVGQGWSGRRALPTADRGDPSPAERIRLAERLDGIAPLLLVADLDELRRLIAAPQQRAPAEAESAPAATLVIDSARSSARCGDREVDLTRLEHDLLTCLITEPVRVWSYAELHRSVWGTRGASARPTCSRW
ncbi:hypothetical protein NKG94_06535 [Micromonospora sp. M12]